MKSYKSQYVSLSGLPQGHSCSSSSSPSSSHLFLILQPSFLPCYNYVNITPHHPFNPALPTVSQLSHVNKWWPSSHNCKLVCFLWDTLRLQKSNISALQKGISVHVCTLQIPKCTYMHVIIRTHTNTNTNTNTHATVQLHHWIPAEPSQVTAL